ncbi:c-type cytochrome biogenesis protein CcsB [Prochlorococcus sp. MIT 1341]|uniref:c-type cytochrome biogenesis protein CcsB n=1 Tax=Prochlorococcus sp. MIT 1341 TaxID=3096221 RepID=UPI002A761ABA|nr:c-type cytochrome biogenesis protein CcsB [Prochlorococcus sp. MIT 1341]
MPVIIDDPVLLLAFVSFVLLLFALPLAFWSVSGNKNSQFARLLIALANFFLTALLILRWWQSGHFPISNLYESLCFLGWASTLIQLLAERSWPSPLVAAASTPIALISVGFANFALPATLQEASPLVPALRSSWLVMHVSVIMSSYASLLIGSALSMAVIFVDREDSLVLRSSSIGIGGFRKVNVFTRQKDNEKTGLRLSPLEISRVEKLDSLSYRMITVGFLLLTIGLISGAVWANEAWGSWWSWDPKETWALICWFFYAAYLHTRLSRGWSGRRPAFLAVGGFIVITLCYIGVNLMGLGLHSYGWFFS